MYICIMFELGVNCNLMKQFLFLQMQRNMYIYISLRTSISLKKVL